jgi:hypothetical protein
VREKHAESIMDQDEKTVNHAIRQRCDCGMLRCVLVRAPAVLTVRSERSRMHHAPKSHSAGRLCSPDWKAVIRNQCGLVPDQEFRLDERSRSETCEKTFQTYHPQALRMWRVDNGVSPLTPGILPTRGEPGGADYSTEETSRAVTVCRNFLTSVALACCSVVNRMRTRS